MRGERQYRARAEDSLRGLLGGECERLVRAGSVFVNGARAANPDLMLAEGDAVVVGAPRTIERCVVLGEIAGLVAVDKPAMLPSEPDRAGSASARGALAVALGVEERRLHAVGRLDVGVSGVMLFAHGKKQTELAARLREQGAIQRDYVGIALRAPVPGSGRWEMDVDGKRAVTDYVTLATAGEVHANGELVRPVLLSLKPITGRKHQLRLHASGAQAPLVGDRAHGGAQRIASANGAVIQPVRVALHARRVSIGEERIEAAVPEDLRDLWKRLGGLDADWALS